MAYRIFLLNKWQDFFLVSASSFKVRSTKVMDDFRNAQAAPYFEIVEKLNVRLFETICRRVATSVGTYRYRMGTGLSKNVGLCHELLACKKNL